MPNIYDIAKKAGVSHMTVSRVFNKPELVGKKTREKITKIANDLNYRPSAIARSMRTKRTNYIGLILPDIINPFFPEIVRGVDDYARKNGFNIILVNTDNDYNIQNASLEIFVNRGVDGLILSGVAGGKKDTMFINEILSKNIPVVLIDRYIPELNSSYVITDNFKAAYNATQYLINLGHKKIGIISSPQKIKIFQDRLNGFESALSASNISFNKELVVECEENMVDGYIGTKELFKRDNKFTAIFAMCDFIAYGAYRYCIENNINIPEDVSIISIDDINTSALLHPPLTTMAQKKYEMGFQAAKILVDSIKKGKIPKKQVVLESELIERQSCKKVT
jgi:DNA-binding LacI/PurR family transcriptional regulator